MTENPYIGSSLDAFLEEEGTLDEINLIAIKRVIAWQIQTAMAIARFRSPTSLRSRGSCCSYLLDDFRYVFKPGSVNYLFFVLTPTLWLIPRCAISEKLFQATIITSSF
ncbi:hypothetical protein [Dolichospermum flos-aquae]|jgi:hypothetical protein|uniref:hypothetical protein n=2 Tax=Dolichospermum TaxID=748770 RepID=UPI001F239EFA|nr:hypothetical protein [Dolichospermum flos-aquae]